MAIWDENEAVTMAVIEVAEVAVMAVVHDVIEVDHRIALNEIGTIESVISKMIDHLAKMIAVVKLHGSDGRMNLPLQNTEMHQPSANETNDAVVEKNEEVVEKNGAVVETSGEVVAKNEEEVEMNEAVAVGSEVSAEENVALLTLATTTELNHALNMNNLMIADRLVKTDGAKNTPLDDRLQLHLFLRTSTATDIIVKVVGWR